MNQKHTNKNFQKHYQSIKHLGSRSGQTFCLFWSGSQLQRLSADDKISKFSFFKKSFRNTFRVSNSLDQDQGRRLSVLIWIQPVCRQQKSQLRGKEWNLTSSHYAVHSYLGAQGLSSRVLDSRLRGRGFKPHRLHCVVVLEQNTFILA